MMATQNLKSARPRTSGSLFNRGHSANREPITVLSSRSRTWTCRHNKDEAFLRKTQSLQPHEKNKIISPVVPVRRLPEHPSPELRKVDQHIASPRHPPALATPQRRHADCRRCCRCCRSSGRSCCSRGGYPGRGGPAASAAIAEMTILPDKLWLSPLLRKMIIAWRTCRCCCRGGCRYGLSVYRGSRDRCHCHCSWYCRGVVILRRDKSRSAATAVGGLLRG